MDPVTRHSVRLFLESLAAAHHAITAADVDATPRGQDPPAIGDCSGDPGTAWSAEHVLGLIVASFAAVAELHPHRVHQKGAIVSQAAELVASPDDPDAPGFDPRPKGSKVTGTTYVGLASCPDCRRGLSGRDDGGLICPQLAPAEAIGSCHVGCIVACGQEG